MATNVERKVERKARADLNLVNNYTTVNKTYLLESSDYVSNPGVATESKQDHNQFKKMKKAYGHENNKNVEFLKKVWCTENRTISSTHNEKTRVLAIKFLRLILRKIFYGHKRNITDTYVGELICNTFGPCSSKHKSSLNLKSKVYMLNEEVEKIIRSIFTIKESLQKFDADHVNCNKSFNCDVQLLTHIFNSACSLPTDKNIKYNEHADSIKRNTFTFVASVDHFIDVFDEIFNILITNKTEDPIVETLHNETTTSVYNKLKKIINKYDLGENKFIKVVLETLPGFMDKISNKDKPTIKGNKTLEKEFADTMKKLKKLQGFIEGLKNKPNRSKRHLPDTDGLEFVLSTIEYWFKRKAALEPEEDGIDLLVEVIKNAPDVIEIQKPYKDKTKPPRVTRTPAMKFKTTVKKMKNTKINPMNLQYEEQRYYPHMQRLKQTAKTTTTITESTTTTDIIKTLDIHKHLQFSDLYQYIQSKNKHNNNSPNTPKLDRTLYKPRHHHPKSHLRMTTTTTTEAAPVLQIVEPDVFPDDEVPYADKVFIQNSHGQDRWADNFIDRSELMNYQNFYDDKAERSYAKSDDFDLVSSTTQASSIKSTTEQSSTTKSSVETTPSSDADGEIRHFKPELDYDTKKGPQLDWVDERFTNLKSKVRSTSTVRTTSAERIRATTIASTRAGTAAIFTDTEDMDDKRKRVDIIQKKNLNFLSSLDYEDKDERPVKEPETGDDFKK